MDFYEPYAGTAQSCVSCGRTVVVPREDGATATPLPIPIETEHLLLRRPEPDDWKDITNYVKAGEPDDADTDVSEVERDVEEQLEAARSAELTDEKRKLWLVIESKEERRLIGDITLSLTDTTHLQASLWIYLHPGCRRRGLATEAGAAALVFCFRGISLHRVTTTCNPDDLASVRLCQRLGMRKEGEFIKYRQVLDHWHSDAFWAMLDEEYDCKTQGRGPTDSGKLPHRP